MTGIVGIDVGGTFTDLYSSGGLCGHISRTTADSTHGAVLAEATPLTANRMRRRFDAQVCAAPLLRGRK